MADSTDTPSSSTKSQKNVRGPTMMNEIMKVRQTGEKIRLEFHPTTGDCIGVGKDNVCHFKSYAALVARTKCSILIDEWTNVSDEIKDAIWTELKAYFIIPESADPKKDRLKKLWIKYAGERWKDFKARLTQDYITKPAANVKLPYEKYKYIDKPTWEEFVKSRETPEFKEKSQKGRENKAKNLYHHVLSRGGYALLEEKMINERKSLRDDSTLTDDDRSPSPPPRHEKWKRARTKKGGEYTSDATKVVAEKIDSLVEETKNGTFVPDGRKDILAEAIGTSEHGGRVRGVGKNHTLSTYFGRLSSRQRQLVDDATIERITSTVEAKVTAKFAAERKLMEEERKVMQQTFMDTLKSIGFSQTSETNKVVELPSSDQLVVTRSTKGSCSAAHDNDKPDDDKREVGNDSVQKLLLMVAQIPNSRYLELDLSHCPSLLNFHMSAKIIKELLLGDIWLDVTTLQVWCAYIHRICIEKNFLEVYGILDPARLLIVQKKPEINSVVKQYIKEKLRDEPKVCHLLPFTHAGHWQMIILCPKDNIVVVLCSLHNDLNETMKKIVGSAFAVHQAATGQRKKATWLYPKTMRQPNSRDCGYYVMKNMLDIVSAKIIGSWMEVFNDPRPLTEVELYDLRLIWAKFFLELYNRR